MRKRIGFIKWVLNYNFYSKDYQELLKDVDVMELSFKKEKDKHEKKIEKLKDTIITKTNRILCLEKLIQERNIEIQELHKELAELRAKEEV